MPSTREGSWSAFCVPVPGEMGSEPEPGEAQIFALLCMALYCNSLSAGGGAFILLSPVLIENLVHRESKEMFAE